MNLRLHPTTQSTLSFPVTTSMVLLLFPLGVTAASWQPYSSSPSMTGILAASTLFPFGSGFHASNNNYFRPFNNDSKQQSLLATSRFRRFFPSRKEQQSTVDEPVQEAANEEVDDDDHNPFHNNPDIPQNRLIEVSSRIELPFSPFVAYDAYSNLPRQPTWSSWLDSVTVSDDKPGESVWTMRFWGITYSWTAVAVKNERPHLIQWKSITGLQNFGTVRFHAQNKNNDGDNDDDSTTTTLMTMKMTFVAPRAVSALFKKSTRLAKYVENKVITQSLYNFRDVVLEKDLKEGQKTPQKQN